MLFWRCSDAVWHLYRRHVFLSITPEQIRISLRTVSQYNPRLSGIRPFFSSMSSTLSCSCAFTNVFIFSQRFFPSCFFDRITGVPQTNSPLNLFPPIVCVFLGPLSLILEPPSHVHGSRFATCNIGGETWDGGKNATVGQRVCGQTSGKAYVYREVQYSSNKTFVRRKPNNMGEH